MLQKIKQMHLSLVGLMAMSFIIALLLAYQVASADDPAGTDVRGPVEVDVSKGIQKNGTPAPVGVGLGDTNVEPGSPVRLKVKLISTKGLIDSASVAKGDIQSVAWVPDTGTAYKFDYTTIITNPDDLFTATFSGRLKIAGNGGVNAIATLYDAAVCQVDLDGDSDNTKGILDTTKHRPPDENNDEDDAECEQKSDYSDYNGDVLGFLVGVNDDHDLGRSDWRDGNFTEHQAIKEMLPSDYSKDNEVLDLPFKFHVNQNVLDTTWYMKSFLLDDNDTNPFNFYDRTGNPTGFPALSPVGNLLKLESGYNRLLPLRNLCFETKGSLSSLSGEKFQFDAKLFTGANPGPLASDSIRGTLVACDIDVNSDNSEPESNEDEMSTVENENGEAGSGVEAPKEDFYESGEPSYIPSNFEAGMIVKRGHGLPDYPMVIRGLGLYEGTDLDSPAANDIFSAIHLELYSEGGGEGVIFISSYYLKAEDGTIKDIGLVDGVLTMLGGTFTFNSGESNFLSSIQEIIGHDDAYFTIRGEADGDITMELRLIYYAETSSGTIEKTIHTDKVKVQVAPEPFLRDADFYWNYIPMDIPDKEYCGKLHIGVKEDNHAYVIIENIPEGEYCYITTCPNPGSEGTSEDITGDSVTIGLKTMETDESIYNYDVCLYKKGSGTTKTLVKTWVVEVFPKALQVSKYNNLLQLALVADVVGETLAPALLRYYTGYHDDVNLESFDSLQIVMTSLDVRHRRLSHGCGESFSAVTGVAPIRQVVFSDTSIISGEIKENRCFIDMVKGIINSKEDEVKASFAGKEVGYEETFVWTPPSDTIQFEKAESIDMYHAIHDGDMDNIRITIKFKKIQTGNIITIEAIDAEIIAEISDIYDFNRHNAIIWAGSAAGILQISWGRDTNPINRGRIFLTLFKIKDTENTSSATRRYDVKFDVSE